MNAIPEQGRVEQRRVGLGPKVLTFSGVAILLIAVAAGLVAAMLFVRVVPAGLVTASGQPGPKALAAVSVPGSVTVHLPEDGVYAVWEVGPDPTSQGMSAQDVTVVDAAGATIGVDPPPMSGSVDAGGLHGRLLAQFEGEAGVALLLAGDPGVPDGTYLVLARGQELPGFAGTLGATVAAWFVAVGGGMLGVLMIVGGIVWWVLRRQGTGRAGQAQHLPPA
ncbi:hypothetical protein [Myceligenerans indicum]|uniref:Uncharacterized protein n=1 Tax=Myceligenerans indicum TaxID=2593663 RepID=A0ABS1LQM0_9MICO|nr:hypothetical protein [Myceligenerans indicum]MBL0888294.1 hypothetical protein [Myceligenerans indicum]